MSELIPFSELDFEATVTSGQVFRFTKTSENRWVGPDGGNVIEAEKELNGWRISSYPDKAAFSSFLRLETSFDKIARRIKRKEPRMAPLVTRFRGLRLVRCSDPVEVLFSFLCTPNNHLSRIMKMVHYLGNSGRKIGSGQVRRFPGAEPLAALKEDELRQAGFGYRARTIVAAARALPGLGGRQWLEDLKRTTADEANSALRRLPGVGQKVADCISLFGLHQTTAVPLDVHLWRAVCSLYLPEWMDAGITHSRYRTAVATFRDKFDEDSGWAQQFLFYDRLTAGRRQI